MPSLRAALVAVACTVALIGSIHANATDPETSNMPRKLELIALIQSRDFEGLERRLAQSGLAFEDYDHLFAYTDPALEADLNVWVSARGDTALPYLVRGIYYLAIAYEKRGAYYANRTHAGRFAGMRKFMALSAKDFARALEIDPTEGAAYASLIDIANSLGNEEEMQALRGQGLRMAPDSVAIHWDYLRGLEPRWGGSWESLQSYVTSLQAKYADDPRFRFLNGHIEQLLAEQLKFAGKHEEALKFIDRAIAAQETPYRHRDRANLLMELGRWDEARDAVERAITGDPDDYESYLIRGKVHYNSEEYDQALADYDTALQLDPYDPDTLLEHARLVGILAAKAKAVGDSAEAESLYRRVGEDLEAALVHGEFEAEVHSRLGRYYMAAGRDVERGHEHFMRSIELMPDIPRFWLAFAEGLLMNWDCRAVETAQRYLDICIASRRCTPDRMTVNLIQNNLRSCQPERLVNDPNLPLPPERSAEVAEMQRCGEFFGQQEDLAAIRACIELANQGEAAAQYDVGLLYIYSATQLTRRGPDVGTPHFQLAVKWLTKAVDQDYTDAIAMLGKMRLHGIGVEADEDTGMKMLRLAVSRDNVQALVFLGWIYRHGLHVEMNEAESLKYYRKARDLGSEQAAQALQDMSDSGG